MTANFVILSVAKNPHFKFMDTSLSYESSVWQEIVKYDTTSQYDKKLSVMINNVLKKLFKFKPHCEFFEFFKKIAAKSIKIAWIYGVCVKISSLSLAFWVKVFSVFAYSFCQPNLGTKVFPPPAKSITSDLIDKDEIWHLQDITQMHIARVYADEIIKPWWKACKRSDAVVIDKNTQIF